MELSYGPRISGLAVDGRELQAGVFNEHEVRAAAGLTMVLGAAAFVYAYSRRSTCRSRSSRPSSSSSSWSGSRFGIQYSPVRFVARWMTSASRPSGLRPSRSASPGRSAS